MIERRSQRGRGLLVVLIALAIVAFLSRDALLGYFGTATRAAAAGDARLPAGARPSVDPTQATPMPAAPIERARGVEDTIRQTYEARRERGDAAAR